MYNAPTDKKDIWNPFFYKDFLGYEPLILWWQQYESQFQDRWPSIQDYNAWFQYQFPQNPLVFISQTVDSRYEQDVYLEKSIPTRYQNWHDFFNNVTWILYPKTKWALVERSFQENASRTHPLQRTKRQNLLAHFDECGMVFCYDKATLIEDIQAFSWKKFFYETVNLSQHGWPMIFGHGLFEKAQNPYIGMTGKVMFLEVTADFFRLPIHERLKYIDLQLAKWILSANFPEEPKALHPFPLLGWPKWHAQNHSAVFYDNQNYFRPRYGSK